MILSWLRKGWAIIAAVGVGLLAVLAWGARQKKAGRVEERGRQADLYLEGQGRLERELEADHEADRLKIEEIESRPRIENPTEDDAEALIARLRRTRK